jgi:hypothetical protein
LSLTALVHAMEVTEESTGVRTKFARARSVHSD